MSILFLSECHCWGWASRLSVTCDHGILWMAVAFLLIKMPSIFLCAQYRSSKFTSYTASKLIFFLARLLKIIYLSYAVANHSTIYYQDYKTWNNYYACATNFILFNHNIHRKDTLQVEEYTWNLTETCLLLHKTQIGNAVKILSIRFMKTYFLKN